MQLAWSKLVVVVPLEMQTKSVDCNPCIAASRELPVGLKWENQLSWGVPLEEVVSWRYLGAGMVWVQLLVAQR